MIDIVHHVGHPLAITTRHTLLHGAQPELDTQNWNAWINIYKGSDGSMQLEKQAFGSWPA